MRGQIYSGRKRKLALGVTLGCVMALFGLASFPALKTILLGKTEYVDVRAITAQSSLKLSSASPAGKFTLQDGEHTFVFRTGTREALIDGTRYWLSFSPKMEGGSYYLSEIDVATLIEPIAKPAATTLPKVTRIVLDPGHGGHDSGAKSLHGFEKDYTLDLTNRVSEILLGNGFEVSMTRTEDVFLPLTERPKVANSVENSLFVSVHLNSGPPTPTARGFEVFAMTPRGAPSTADKYNATEVMLSWPGNRYDTESLILADAIHRTVLKNTDLFDRGVKRARFSVLKNAEVPGVLIEAGFLSNVDEATRIHESTWRQKLASSIADGITKYAAAANQGFEINRYASHLSAKEKEFITR